MKLVLDKKHGNRIEFLVDGISLPFANMLRRYSISMVPVLAMDTITFYDNNTAFWDEYLAHRLGLLPVTTPENLPKDVEIVFSLDAEGPKMVYSSELKSTDKGITIAQDKIPLVTLGSGQLIKLEGKAILGTGKTHAKFQSGLVSYGEEGKGMRFVVESFYHMEPMDVLKRGCDAIEGNLEDIEAALGEKPKKKTAAKKTTKKAAAKKPAVKKPAAKKTAAKKPAAKKKAVKKKE
jgi:DNA-directed RNA polymerase subunit D